MSIGFLSEQYCADYTTLWIVQAPSAGPRVLKFVMGHLQRVIPLVFHSDLMFGEWPRLRPIPNNP